MLQINRRVPPTWVLPSLHLTLVLLLPSLFNMSTFRLGGLLAAALLSSRSLAQTCVSYGIDFQNGGNYFQNISSTDAFTFASLFEGCDNDVANNLLVDPNGDEHQCTDTPLQPDDTTQLSTCPMDKNQLWSGDWSVLIISNNGDADPIAYERDFYLNVGLPSTTTYTPTVTIYSTTTPLVLVTETSTIISTTTLPAVTTTVASVTKSPTVTITPAKSTVVTTKTATLKKTAYTAVPILTTKTITATCSIPTTQKYPDPTCTITPTLITAAALSTDDSASSTAAATPSASAAVKIRRGLFDRSVPLEREARIAERKARREAANKLQRRAPDVATTTLTETNTSLYITSTSVSTDIATTITSTAVATSTSTFTPPVVTVKSGKTTLAVVTTTLKQSTTTKTIMTVLTTTVKTVTSSPTVTISITSTPSKSAVACTAKGGQMK
ncbi:hypothetical protein D6D05_00897 [Aureobasidium pullulans]|nr:hypothetical protein D6D05_00897 [Aureobasidium pullulans]